MFTISTAGDILEVEKEKNLTYITITNDHTWFEDERSTIMLTDNEVKELIHYLNNIVKDK